MSEQATPVEGITTTAEQQPEPPVASDPKRVRADDLPEDALKARLEQAKRSATRELLEAIGVEGIDDAKQALEKYREYQQAQKTELERARDEASRHAADAGKVGRYRSVLQQRVDAELSELSDSERAAVAKLGGDDPAGVLDAIDTLRSGGMLAVRREQSRQDAAPPAPPATTATAPAPSAPGAQPESATADHRQTYRALREQNPFAAAAYGLRNPGRVFAPDS